ncbi:MAG: hypothetical protein V3U90_00930 [Dehalococcoidia bacterium]
MQSSLIGKIEKAKRYAEEPHRITFSSFTADFHGEHNNYTISYQDGKWGCSCNFFSGWDTCSHTMALEKILEGMLPKDTLALQKAAE